MKILWTCFLLCLPTILLADKPDEQLHKKCIYPTVKVTKHPDYDRAFGTGVILQSVKAADGYHNYVLTCRHVVRGILDSIGLNPFEHKFSNENQYVVVKYFKYVNWSKCSAQVEAPCSLVHLIAKKDLAIVLFVTQEEMATVDTSPHSPMYLGSDLFKTSCALGDATSGPCLDYGKMTSVDTALTLDGVIYDGLFRTSIPGITGGSGGPIFCKDDGKYKLIGVMNAIKKMDVPSSLIINRNFVEIPTTNLVFHISYGISLDKMDLNTPIIKHEQALRDKKAELPKVPDPPKALAPAPPPPPE